MFSNGYRPILGCIPCSQMDFDQLWDVLRVLKWMLTNSGMYSVFLNGCRPILGCTPCSQMDVDQFWDVLPCSEIDIDIDLRTRQYIPEDSEIHTRSKYSYVRKHTHATAIVTRLQEFYVLFNCNGITSAGIPLMVIPHPVTCGHVNLHAKCPSLLSDHNQN
jgi:hypothetical protein